MVIVIKIHSHIHQNLFRYDVELPIVSFDSVLKLGYPLRVGELVTDS